ncbi:MAG: hypothetical protein ACRDJH_26710 [Thermomicrobiales bacterium]
MVSTFLPYICVHSTLSRKLTTAPGVMRARSAAKPICPEGERSRGIPVWRDYQFEELEERRVM